MRRVVDGRWQMVGGDCRQNIMGGVVKSGAQRVETAGDGWVQAGQQTTARYWTRTIRVYKQLGFTTHHAPVTPLFFHYFRRVNTSVIRLVFPTVHRTYNNHYKYISI